MATRATMIFSMATTPGLGSNLPQRFAGWSESIWFAADIPVNHAGFRRIREARAVMMSDQSSISGIRLSRYNLIGNRLVSLGSAVDHERLIGSIKTDTDIPQMSLQVNCTAVGKTNKTHLALAAIPDNMVLGGDYAPTAPYRDKVVRYGAALVAQNACFLGRDFSQQSVRVISIAGGVVTLEAALPGAAVGSSIRLARVRDSVTGKKISGAFSITAIAGVAYTVAGLTGDTAGQSGTARLDLVTLCQFEDVTPFRVTVRKVGRPFNAYRGRASKR